MKKFIGFVGLAASLAFAQVGINGGSDGIHQQNAKTLGQWGVMVGAGGNFAMDAWAMSRGGAYTDENGKKFAFNDWDGSLSGNVYAAVGLLDFLDVGFNLPLYYEHANSDGGPAGAYNMWTTSRGDLDTWVKIRAPFDKSSIFGLATIFDFYIPTGEEAAGVRPRHAWYLNDRYTHPFTANSFAMGATMVFTLDLSKKDIPFRWNVHSGLVATTDQGEPTTWVYGTGVNWLAKDWMDAFLEFSGEMRIVDTQYPVDPLSDPMVITPGLRFHLPAHIDVAVGLDVAVRALSNFFYDYKEEMKGCEDFSLNYIDATNKVVSHYCYAPTPLYAATALVTWRFGGDDVKDTDKDGVPDDKDQCNFTKEGVKVDANGCPFDTDKDGVIDDMDQCPNTAAGVVVDTAGCPMDTAAVDSAAAETAPADTSAADTSAADNCAAKETAPADSDGDGVLDANDKCPNTKQGAAVDSVGCALDSDKDGVADADDKCAETAAGVEVDETGCPRDFDKDGVADYMDKCPNTKAGATVDSVGCPKDSDFDGVPDGADKCENTENGVAVDASGCPLDSDKDGVPDHLDKCPNTLSGVKIDSVGCPLKKKEDLNKLKRGIRFKTNSTKLTKSSYGTLDDIIALLNKIPSANLEVQGHTDNVGKDDFNQKLSEARAQTVVDYFVKKGIDSSRVRAAGFGSKKPVASNKNAKGREKNRRVELVPFEK